jgi:cobaltochelatase CobN
MPHGLHVFGRDWSAESLKLMADSMAQVSGGYDPAIAQKLKDLTAPGNGSACWPASPGASWPPGKGNDPLRSPDALPTGRNFHAVDGDLLPTKIGFKLGLRSGGKGDGAKARVAVQAPPALRGSAARTGCESADSDAVILWASDAVRDEGAMVAFCLSLLGAEPVWNARGIVTDVRLTPGAVRRDVIVTTSGLFRDLYPNLLNQIDRAGRLALAASAGSLIANSAPSSSPRSTPAGAARWHRLGPQPLAGNRVAQAWLATHRAALQTPV